MRTFVSAVVGALVLSGCPSDGYFVCSTDSECTQAMGGRCEANGACSFPDAACDTGRRYGEAGNPQIAGECVPPGGVGSTGTGTSAGVGSGASDPSMSGTSMSGTSMSSVGTSDAETSDGTTAAEGSTGDASTSATASSSSGGSSSSTGDPGPPADMYEDCAAPEECDAMVCAMFVQPGDLDPFGAFCSDIACGDPMTDCLDPGTGATPTCIDIPVNGVAEPICALDCDATGAAGCPAGMTCLNNIIGLPSICAHPP